MDEQVHAITIATSKHLQVPIDVLCNTKNKTQSVAYARRLAMYVARKMTLRPYYQIAKNFGSSHQCVAIAYHRVTLELDVKLEKTEQDVAVIINALE